MGMLAIRSLGVKFAFTNRYSEIQTYCNYVISFIKLIIWSASIGGWSNFFLISFSNKWNKPLIHVRNSEISKITNIYFHWKISIVINKYTQDKVGTFNFCISLVKFIASSFRLEALITFHFFIFSLILFVAAKLKAIETSRITVALSITEIPRFCKLPSPSIATTRFWECWLHLLQRGT